jgi:O-antigen ligase
LNFRNLTTERLKVPIAIAVGLTLAVGLGLAVGGGQFSLVRRVFLLGVLLSIMLFGQQHAWRAAFAVCLLDVVYQGFGFSMWNIEQTGLIALLIVLLTWWRKERIKTPRVMDTPAFGVFNLALLAWLLYSFGHLIYNTLDPYSPSEFALKNFLKTFVQFSGPLILLFYFIHRPTGIVVNKRLPNHIVEIGLLAITVHLAIRCWELAIGRLDPAVQSDNQTQGFAIYSLDLMANFYALRGLAPLLGVVAIVFIASPWFRRQSPLARGALWLLYVFCVVGAILSGGRATLIFLFVLSLAALWLRHYYQLVMIVTIAGPIFVLGLNLIPNVLRPFPMIVQRSLQSVVFTSESEDARSSIESSTSWRRELVQRAFELWRVDPRVFWFGRATYKFGDEDFRALKRDTGEGSMEVSLRRGATHSLVTDLLLVFGLIGFVIYMTMFVMLVVLLWRLWRNKESDEITKSLALSCFLLGVFAFVYGIVGGGSISIQLTWLLIVLFAYLYRQEANSPDQPTAPLRRVAPTRPRRLTAVAPSNAWARSLRHKTGFIRR